MANRKFLVDIDLTKNQLLNAKLQNLASHPTVIVGTDEGYVYWNTTDEKAYIYTGVGTVWISLTGSNLSAGTRSSTEAPIDNDNGDGVSLAVATSALAGLESAADKTRLDKTVLTDDINVKANSWVIDEDDLSSDLDTKVPTQQSVKAYVDGVVVGGVYYQGAYDASVAPPTGTGVLKGHMYTVTVAGDGAGFFAKALQVGDVIISEKINPIADADWTQVNKNIPDIVASSETASGIIELATQTEVDDGTDAVRAVTPATLESKLGLAGSLTTPRKYTENLATSVTSYTITHGLATSNVTVSVRDTLTPFHEIEVQVTIPNTSTVVLGFNVAPTAGQYQVTIIG
jgi:hypothetical protein